MISFSDALNLLITSPKFLCYCLAMATVLLDGRKSLHCNFSVKSENMTGFVLFSCRWLYVLKELDVLRNSFPQFILIFIYMLLVALISMVMLHRCLCPFFMFALLNSM